MTALITENPFVIDHRGGIMTDISEEVKGQPENSQDLSAEIVFMRRQVLQAIEIREHKYFHPEQQPELDWAVGVIPGTSISHAARFAEAFSTYKSDILATCNSYCGNHCIGLYQCPLDCKEERKKRHETLHRLLHD